MPYNRHGHARGRFPLFLVFAVAKALISGGLVMLLWNFVLPAVTSVRALTYIQGVGLWLLCRMMFGNFHFGGAANKNPSSSWRGRPWKDKWMQMTTEEREKFREEWKKRWGGKKL